MYEYSTPLYLYYQSTLRPVRVWLILQSIRYITIFKLLGLLLTSNQEWPTSRGHINQAQTNMQNSAEVQNNKKPADVSGTIPAVAVQVTSNHHRRWTMPRVIDFRPTIIIILRVHRYIPVQYNIQTPNVTTLGQTPPTTDIIFIS